MSKILISLSGGMDSATLLGKALYDGQTVKLISFTYGSKHNKYENDAAIKIAEYYGIDKPKYIELDFINKHFKSDLLLSGDDIPEGHYNDSNMSKTVVPCRNLIFASILAGYAESIGFDKIWLGTHSGDHHIYADCRPEFTKALQETALRATDGKVLIEAPFENIDKTGILKIGYSLKSFSVPYHLTRTCYKDQPLSCSVCGSCRERLEAFDNININDPIEYEVYND